MKNNKGITLASLVLTIIVLLILASIFVYSGVNTVRYTKFNKAKSEISVVQTNVNSWYQELKNIENTDEYKALQTDDEKQQYKNNFLNDKGYGVTTDDPACSQKKLDDTLQGLNDKGIEIENFDNYRFLSSTFLENKLGLNASYDFLANIEDRTVILFGGLEYNGEWYYTMEDFGLTNIKSNTISGITFDLAQGDNTEIVISNLKMTDNENNKIDFSKFIVEYMKKDDENSNWIDVTKIVVKFEDGEENNKKTKYKFSVDSFGEYDVRVRTTDKKLGDVKDITLEPRPGIKVGDYITYTSPTASVTFKEAETGYSGTQNPLERKTLFRVMDIDDLGNMTLIGAMTSSDQKIYFTGALGYNNAVYTLNKKCSDLYKDTSKGITARSIKVEDITDRMIEGTKGETTAASTGKKKLEKYQDEQVAALPKGTYITATDLTKNTVTYKTITNYPDIFQYETGGLIDSTATYGVIGQSDSYRGYNGLTILANKTPIPTNLTVPYTYYCVEPDVSDFDNTKGNAAAYENMFFETSTNYWLASRCIGCHSDRAGFRVRTVGDSYIGAFGLYGSGNDTDGSDRCVCPVVNLPSSVEVTASTEDNSKYHQSKPHEVK